MRAVDSGLDTKELRDIDEAANGQTLERSARLWELRERHGELSAQIRRQRWNLEHRHEFPPFRCHEIARFIERKERELQRVSDEIAEVVGEKSGKKP